MSRLWIDTPLALAVAVAATSNASLMTGVSATETRLSQMTLLRTIIGLDVARTVHDSGEGSETVTLGIGVVSQAGFSTGAIPNPATATEFPIRGWVWKAAYRTFGFAADQPAVFNRRIDLDIRAMRKLENGEAYIAVAVVALEGVSGAVTIHGLVRQLWLVS